VRPVPEKFADAVKLVAAAVSCVNCRHCHGLIEKPLVDEHAPEQAESIAS